MRNRTKTIEALRRLAERPGTPQEGETARRLLERIEEAKPFRYGIEFDEPRTGALNVWA